MRIESPIENQHSSRMFMINPGCGYMETDQIAKSVRILCSQLTYIFSAEVRVFSFAKAQQDSRSLVHFVSDSPEVQDWLNRNIYYASSDKIIEAVQRLALNIFSERINTDIPFEY